MKVAHEGNDQHRNDKDQNLNRANNNRRIWRAEAYAGRQSGQDRGRIAVSFCANQILDQVYNDDPDPETRNECQQRIRTTLPQRLKRQPFDQHPDEPGHNSAKNGRQRKWQRKRQLCSGEQAVKTKLRTNERKGEVSAEGENGAMRKINYAENGKDQGITQSKNRINAANGEAVQQVLDRHCFIFSP
jgi:hypothetical protein